MLGIIIGSTLDIFVLSGWMCSLSRGAIHDASVYNHGAIMLGRSRGAAKINPHLAALLCLLVKQTRFTLLFGG
jgi:hypothetical protein